MLPGHKEQVLVCTSHIAPHSATSLPSAPSYSTKPSRVQTSVLCTDYFLEAFLAKLRKTDAFPFWDGVKNNTFEALSLVSEALKDTFSGTKDRDF